MTLPTRQESTSVKRALADRLLISEAIDAVGKMIRGYPNRGQADKSYIGAIADLLLHYPREVALRCADPFRGVARETKFMPTPSDIIGWCERDARSLHERSAREDRIAEQFRAMDEYEAQTVPESLKAKGRSWLDRTDPQARELAGLGEHQPTIAEYLQDAAQVGVELSTMRLSPAALKILAEKHSDAEP